MDNCNKSCSDCKSELTSMLCDVPSKWREQIVNVICNTVSNYGVCCTDVLTCINNELDTLDYSCLAESAAEWETYSFLQKLQVIIDRICEGTGASPDFDATSDSLIITAAGDQGHTPNFEVGISEDADNILIAGTDGYLYVPAQNTPPLVANDSTSINFTNGGTAGHTLTGVVILDPSVDNVLVNNGTGLLVDGSAFESPLTFNNGINRSSNIVQLGGSLITDTELVLDTFIFDITGTDGTVASTTTFTNSSFTNGSHDDTSDLFSLLSNQYNLFVAELRILGVSPSSYYALGQIAIDSAAVKLGHYFPTVNGVGSAPANEKFKTSYILLEEGKIDTYASKFKFLAESNTQSAGSIVSGRRYQILNNGGGADFTGSGASVNTVGTIFTSNGVTPNWGTGSLELLGLFSVDSKESSFTGQVLVGSGTQTAIAKFEVQSTTKGSIPFPKMTAAQRGALTPVDGLAVYQTDATNGVYVYDGTASAWKKLTWT